MVEFVYLKNPEGLVRKREKSRVDLFKSLGWEECLPDGKNKPSDKKKTKE